MFKEKLKKFIGKKSTGVIVSILTFGVIFGAIFSCSNVTYAADSLPGIVDIRNNISSSDTPYNILEIVPDKNSAEIGFLIGGEEPLYFDTTSNTWMDWRTYLAGHTEDMTPDQRKAFVDGLYTANTTYIGVSSSDAKPLWYQDYQEVVDEIMKILVDKGIGMEFNTSGMDACGDYLPGIEYLRRFKKLGGEIVTIGSDAHHSNRVGQYCHEAAEIVQENTNTSGLSLDDSEDEFPVCENHEFSDEWVPAKIPTLSA